MTSNFISFPQVVLPNNNLSLGSNYNPNFISTSSASSSGSFNPNNQTLNNTVLTGTTDISSGVLKFDSSSVNVNTGDLNIDGNGSNALKIATNPTTSFSSVVIGGASNTLNLNSSAVNIGSNLKCCTYVSSGATEAHFMGDIAITPSQSNIYYGSTNTKNWFNSLHADILDGTNITNSGSITCNSLSSTSQTNSNNLTTGTLNTGNTSITGTLGVSSTSTFSGAVSNLGNTTLGTSSSNTLTLNATPTFNTPLTLQYAPSSLSAAQLGYSLTVNIPSTNLTYNGSIYNKTSFNLPQGVYLACLNFMINPTTGTNTYSISCYQVGLGTTTSNMLEQYSFFFNGGISGFSVNLSYNNNSNTGTFILTNTSSTTVPYYFNYSIIASVPSGGNYQFYQSTIQLVRIA